MKELGELAGHLFSRPLDRSRPLWEFWYIEGLAGGKVAMFMKNHHCLMDGQAGVGLAEVLTDLSPDATAPPIVPDVMKEGTPVAPSALEIAAQSARNALARQAKRVEHIGRGLRAVASSLWPSASDEFAPPSWSDVPPLPFNKLVGMRRSFACASLDLEELKTIKKHFDVTLNDVVLEVIGGALRRWLRAKGELPERPIVAMCPVSLRAEGDQSLSNQITMMPVSLATDLEDPADRLRRIAKNSARSKETVKQGSFDVLAAVSESARARSGRPAHARDGDRARQRPAAREPRRLERARRADPALHGGRADRVDVPDVRAPGGSGPERHRRVLHEQDGVRLHRRSRPRARRARSLREIHRSFEELQAAAEGVVHRAA